MSSLRAATILSKSETNLLRALDRYSSFEASTTLLALHAPASSLKPVFSRFSEGFCSTNIGCLSDPISREYPYSLSFLQIPESIKHCVWRSEIPGDKSQVGRWYSNEQRHKENYNSLSSAHQASRFRTAELPEELKKLSLARQRFVRYVAERIYKTNVQIGQQVFYTSPMTPQMGSEKRSNSIYPIHRRLIPIISSMNLFQLFY